MYELIDSRFRKIFLFFLFFALFANVIFAQTYHDCTATEDFNEFLDNKENTEDMIVAMASSLA